MTTYTISLDPARVQFDRVHALLTESYWSPRIRADVLRTAIKNSIVAGAFEAETGRQVAFARVVTDQATFAWLCDVIVDPAHRGKGLAKRMCRELDADPRLQTLRRWCLATRDAHSLYAQFGFEPVPEGRWMEKRLPVERWQAAELGPGSTPQ